MLFRSLLEACQPFKTTIRTKIRYSKMNKEKTARPVIRRFFRLDWGRGSGLGRSVARGGTRSPWSVEDGWISMCSVTNSKINSWISLLLHSGDGKCILWTIRMHLIRSGITFPDFSKKSNHFTLDLSAFFFEPFFLHFFYMVIFVL